MKVLFLVPRLDKASTRYRVLQYLPFLEKAGIECTVRALSGKIRPWLSLPGAISRADVVFVQKKVLNWIAVAAVRYFARRLVFDFDDAIMFKETEVKAASCRHQFRRFAANIRRADLVICGNRFLAEKTTALHDNLQILPTVVDDQRYRPLPAPVIPRAGEGLVIGWIGSRHTLLYLEAIAPQLQAVCRAIPGTRLKIIADAFFELEGVEVIKKNWSSDEEIADLQSFDIGIMPLPDTPWCRGKCGFKLIQYMALGIPVVCSPVGVNSDIVTHGREGFHARNAEEWVERLVQLLKHKHLRESMGRCGRETISARYSLQANADYLIRLLHDLSKDYPERRRR